MPRQKSVCLYVGRTALGRPFFTVSANGLNWVKKQGGFTKIRLDNRPKSKIRQDVKRLEYLLMQLRLKLES